MKKSLYHIETEALELASALENGELTEELELALIINQEELQHKAINYGYVIKDSQDTIEAIDNEIKRLQALKKTETNKQDRLKEAITAAMNIYGIEEVKTPTMKLNFRSSESIEIINGEQLGPQYKIFNTTISVDKVAIKKAIKEGKEVEGAVLVKNQNLQIK